MSTREKIISEAQALKPQQIKFPLRVLLDEALDLAKNFAHYWSAGIGPAGVDHPGLVSLGASLPAELGEEILLCRQLTQEAQTRYLLLRNAAQGLQFSSPDSVPQSKSDSVQRGRFVLAELQASLRWLLQNFLPPAQDGEPAQGQKLESAAKSLKMLDLAHSQNKGRAVFLSQTLHDYAAVARPLQNQLDGLGGFDAKLIDEAEHLSEHMWIPRRGRPAPSPQVLQAKRQRDQVASLLQAKMQQLRAAARFVFRGRKDILQNFSSAHQRRLRQRRKLGV